MKVNLKLVKRYEDQVQSVSKALMVLEALAKETDGIGIIELSDNLGLNKTTVYRILTTLMIYQFVEQDKNSGKYLLGIKVLGLANAFLKSKDIRALIRPYLSEFKDKYNVQIFLSKLEREELIIIDKLESERITNFKVGDKLPIYCTAMGKVHLSNQQFNELKKILANEKLIKYTSKTNIETDKIMEEVKLIPLQGYAIEDEEYIDGLASIAVPIFDYATNIVAVIGVYFDTEKVQKDIRSLIILHLLKISEQISYKLGYNVY